MSDDPSAAGGEVLVELLHAKADLLSGEDALFFEQLLHRAAEDLVLGGRAPLVVGMIMVMVVIVVMIMVLLGQAIAVVVAETFEQATAAAALLRVDYAPSEGSYDLKEALKTAPLAKDPNSPEKQGPPESRTGDFEQAFAQAPVKLDELYTTPDQSHSMMEPHASIASWNGEAQASPPSDRFHSGGWMCRYQTLRSGSWDKMSHGISCHP